MTEPQTAGGEETVDHAPDEEVVLPIVESRAHWSLFLPSLVVALVYTAAWALLVITGRGDGTLAKLMFLVMMIAPPILLVQAFLRYNSIGLALTKNHVLVSKGWPRLAGEQIGLKNLSAVEVRFSVVGRWLGAGRVVLLQKDGRVVSVSDLDQPEEIADAIQSHIPPFMT